VDQCNPTCGGFVCVLGSVNKMLVMTHLKAPFEFRLMGMQEENDDIFFVKLFLCKKTKIIFYRHIGVKIDRKH
jgi:hypothetical protein